MTRKMKIIVAVVCMVALGCFSGLGITLWMVYSQFQSSQEVIAKVEKELAESQEEVKEAKAETKKAKKKISSETPSPKYDLLLYGGEYDSWFGEVTERSGDTMTIYDNLLEEERTFTGFKENVSYTGSSVTVDDACHFCNRRLPADRKDYDSARVGDNVWLYYPTVGEYQDKAICFDINNDDESDEDVEYTSTSTAIETATPEPTKIHTEYDNEAGFEFVGTWVSDRCTMNISASNNGSGDIYYVSISWGNSATEMFSWSYTGSYSNGIINLTGSKDIIRDSGTENVYSGGTATISIQGSGNLIWTDNMENAGSGLVFSRY